MESPESASTQDPEKLRLRKQEVPYIEHLLTAEGLKVDPEKVRAITDMSPPADVKGVQRLRDGELFSKVL